MNSKSWQQYFEQNRLGRSEPHWNVPSGLDLPTQKILGRSLSHFQLGETGGGSFLLGQARTQLPDDFCYRQALTLFVEEEKEHERLLTKLVARFGGS